MSKENVSYLTQVEITAANEFGESIRQLVHNQVVPATNRTRAAIGCLGIAQEHHHGIVLMLSSSLYASAFALMRAMFEAYVRGEWLGFCATEAQVERFLRNKDVLGFQAMIDAIEAADGVEDQHLSTIKRQRWDALCGYTHTGGIHVQRWQTEESVEPIYSREEVLEVLYFAEMVLVLSSAGIFKHSCDELAVQKAFELYRSRIANFLSRKQ